MIKLKKSMRAWGTSDFKDILKQELAQCAEHLPLHKGLSSGSHVADEPITVLINKVVELEGVIRVQVGIFYQGLMLGCSCADDPSPPGESNEYCEVQLDIDRASAVTTVALVTE